MFYRIVRGSYERRANMVKPMYMALVAALGSMLLAGCTSKSKPQGETAPQRDASSSVPAKGKSSKVAGPQRVTLYVEGMTKVQGIT